MVEQKPEYALRCPGCKWMFPEGVKSNFEWMCKCRDGYWKLVGDGWVWFLYDEEGMPVVKA